MADLRVSSLGGIPKGNTANRSIVFPSPQVGDVYYNGQLGLLEIYDGTNWVPSSAPAGIPSITATDVGTGRAYASGAINLSFTAATNGGAPYGYTGIAVLGANTYTTGSQTSTTSTLNVGIPGTYSVSATSYNGFGSSPNSVPISVAVTTVPEAPTIGTASISSTSTDVTITWTLGNNGGKNLSAITITPYLNGTTAQTSRTAATTNSTSYTFTGASALDQASTYTFKVKATNANGDSLESSASNSITVPFLIEYLVVAGGGGAGTSNGAAGGGAGGMKTGNSYFASGATAILTVGSGGSGTSSNSSRGGDGTGSQFGSITTSGGGGSGSEGSGTIRQGNSGGSGGGSVRSNYYGGSGISGEGNDGGMNVNDGSPHYAGGGGGGKGAAGQNGQASGDGNGGIGATSSITGTSTYYAGGGGAGYYNNNSGQATGGSGGLGGGAAGGSNPSDGRGRNGSTNTGGGAGGYGLTGQPGGNGGSGVVILAMNSSFLLSSIPGSLTYTSSTTSRSGYRVYTFTAGTGTVTI